MSSFNFQQPVEQLYAFMDGELDPAFEQQLFSELAQNQELRLEMKDLMAMRQAVQQDVLLPSPFVKDRILAAAGFSGSVVATATKWQYVQRISSTLVKPLMGMILGAGLTAMILMSDVENNTAMPSANNTANRPEWTLRIPMDEHSALKTGSTRQRVARRYQTVSARQLSAAAPAAIIAEVHDAEANSLPTFTNADISAPPPMQQDVPQLPKNESFAQQPAQSISTTTATTPVNTHSELDNSFSIRIRGLYTLRSFPTSTIYPADNNWLNSAAFGAMYNFNPDISAGVEIGMERFAQVFGSAEGASETWYEQNPQMLWAGVLMQYNIWQIEPTTNLHIYGESFAGAAGTLGLLGRQTLGINVSPIPAVTISAGAEAAVLPYIFKGQWFSTEKIGLTFGLSFTPEGLR